ncbi:hypothetical protein [Gaoshiqia sediminis]|uniref:Uncharacterized protein n=1 Tax=Gaoshiqia sediminis TaxID=2986998 RepID=A0AA41Y5V5_9BACT|nr:hypothetical protein [Gaoshiqia sediminis]MCW0483974.1 hypothetical protein [Gaoshiqia sediminis]
MAFKKADLASFNIPEQAWIVDAGSNDVLVGASSQELKAKPSLEIPKTEWVEKVTKTF